ncbi:MAG: recombinase family protein [Lachnospiraceae bacterium]
MLGYEKGEDGTWKIHAEQAEIVQYMFQRFASGQSANKIATELNALGKTTVNGKQWAAGSVLLILRNEKYAGDLETQ